jgi:hypothetical protein
LRPGGCARGRVERDHRGSRHRLIERSEHDRGFDDHVAGDHITSSYDIGDIADEQLHGRQHVHQRM